MHRPLIRFSVFIVVIAAVLMTARAGAKNPRIDFGSFVQDQLRDHSEQLFGLRHPLDKSARIAACRTSDLCMRSPPR